MTKPLFEFQQPFNELDPASSHNPLGRRPLPQPEITDDEADLVRQVYEDFITDQFRKHETIVTKFGPETALYLTRRAPDDKLYEIGLYHHDATAIYRDGELVSETSERYGISITHIEERRLAKNRKRESYGYTVDYKGMVVRSDYGDLYEKEKLNKKLGQLASHMPLVPISPEVEEANQRNYEEDIANRWLETETGVNHQPIGRVELSGVMDFIDAAKPIDLLMKQLATTKKSI